MKAAIYIQGLFVVAKRGAIVFVVVTVGGVNRSEPLNDLLVRWMIVCLTKDAAVLSKEMVIRILGEEHIMYSAEHGDRSTRVFVYGVGVIEDVAVFPSCP